MLRRHVRNGARMMAIVLAGGLLTGCPPRQVAPTAAPAALVTESPLIPPSAEEVDHKINAEVNWLWARQNAEGHWDPPAAQQDEDGARRQRPPAATTATCAAQQLPKLGMPAA